MIVRAPLIGAMAHASFPVLHAPGVHGSSESAVDGGFDETLPYDVAEPGRPEAVVPADQVEAAGPLIGTSGRGLAIPIATALLLAVWAVHIRYLARASRPV